MWQGASIRETDPETKEKLRRQIRGPDIATERPKSHAMQHLNFISL